MEQNQALLESLRATKQAAPCVSIYLEKPDGRLQEEVLSIALYRELAYAKSLLENSHSRQQAEEYVKPLLLVAKEELLSDGRGTIALFRSGEVSACIRLSEKTPPQTVVADSFHIKPLASSTRPTSFKANPAATEACLQALAAGSALTSFYAVAQALKKGAVKRLWIAEDVTIWGLLSRRHGTVVLHPAQLNDHDGDVLDDLAEWGLDEGIEVAILPIETIPGRYPMIAELR